MRKMTYRDRLQLEGFIKAGMRVAEISGIMGFSPKSIYYELRKGAVKLLSSDLIFYTSYSADKAQQVTELRKDSHSPGLKIGSNHAAARRIDELVSEKYSPYAISKKLNDEGLIKLSKSTIYSYIYKGVVMSSCEDLIAGRRRKKASPEPPKENKTKLGRSIDERPKSVLLRSEFGHWEMDTVQPAKGCRSCFLVLTERMSRLEIIRKLPSRESVFVLRELRRLRRSFGVKFKDYFKTITPDNGSEFSQAYKLESRYLKIYFCHPSSPGERGSNENNNRFIRRWYPKGVSFDDVTSADVFRLQDYLNGYPREMFDGLSAAEVAAAAGFEMRSMEGRQYNGR